MTDVRVRRPGSAAARSPRWCPKASVQDICDGEGGERLIGVPWGLDLDHSEAFDRGVPILVPAAGVLGTPGCVQFPMVSRSGVRVRHQHLWSGISRGQSYTGDIHSLTGP